MKSLQILFFILSFSFISLSIWGAEEDFPECIEDSKTGYLDPNFFDDLSRLSLKLDVCDATMDPRMKALSYIKSLYDYSEKLPKLVENEVDQAKEYILEQSKKSSSKNYNLKIPLQFEEVLIEDTLAEIYYEINGQKSLQIAKGFPREIFSTTNSLSRPSNAEVSVDYRNQIVYLEKFKNKFNDQIIHFNQRLGEILNSIENSKTSSPQKLSRENSEYVRLLVCQFMPSETSSESSGKRGDFNSFCSDRMGGQNFNKERGKLFCTDIERLKGSNKNSEMEKLRSAISKSFVKNLSLPDEKKIYSETTSGRIEVKIEQTEGEEKKVNLSFYGVGGIQRVCSLLKSPEYTKYWRTIKGKKVLGPVLPISALNVPIVVDWNIKQKTFKMSEVFTVNESGEAGPISINNKKLNQDQRKYHQKTLDNKKSEIQFISVRSLVNDQCDEK